MKFLFLLLLISTQAFAENLSDSIPYPFFDVQTESENEMMVLNRPEAALQARIDLIRKAKETIELEYFIYKRDMAGKIITRELVAAAKRGVKVRMLLDKLMAIKGLNHYHARELQKHGIKIKYYHTAFILKISSINYRNHRKLIVVDDKEAITGGRNIGNDYFGLSKKYNFEDRDVLIKGPIVKTMRESFDAYFNNKIANNPKNPRIKFPGQSKKARKFLEETEEELKVRAEIERIARQQLANSKSHLCPETTFSTDAPGAGFLPARKKNFGEKYRHLRKTLADKMEGIDKELTISSPYFIANKRNKKLLENLLEKKVKVNVYTNSLKAADKIYMVANFYFHLKGWVKKGIHFFLNDGKWSEIDVALPASTETRWGTHAKTHVYETSDYTEIMIGTYNIDNRSDHYNNEMAIFCKGNDELSQEVKNEIMTIAQQGIIVNSERDGYDRFGNRVNITGATFFKKLKMNAVTIPSRVMAPLL